MSQVGSDVKVDLGYARIDVPARDAIITEGEEVSVSVRSELLQLVDPDDDSVNRIPATYVEEVYLGLTTSHLVRLSNGTEVVIRQVSEGEGFSQFSVNQEVEIGWQKDSARLHPN